MLMWEVTTITIASGSLTYDIHQFEPSFEGIQCQVAKDGYSLAFSNSEIPTIYKTFYTDMEFYESEQWSGVNFSWIRIKVHVTASCDRVQASSFGLHLSSKMEKWLLTI